MSEFIRVGIWVILCISPIAAHVVSKEKSKVQGRKEALDDEDRFYKRQNHFFKMQERMGTKAEGVHSAQSAHSSREQGDTTIYVEPDEVIQPDGSRFKRANKFTPARAWNNSGSNGRRFLIPGWAILGAFILVAVFSII